MSQQKEIVSDTLIPEGKANIYLVFLQTLEAKLGIRGLHVGHEDASHQATLKEQLRKISSVFNSLSRTFQSLPDSFQESLEFKAIVENIKTLNDIISALSPDDINHGSLLNFVSELQATLFTDYAQFFWAEQILDPAFSLELKKRRIAQLATTLGITEQWQIDELITGFQEMLSGVDKTLQVESRFARKMMRLAETGTGVLLIATLLISCVPTPTAPTPATTTQTTEATVEPTEVIQPQGYKFIPYAIGGPVLEGTLTITPAAVEISSYNNEWLEKQNIIIELCSQITWKENTSIVGISLKEGEIAYFVLTGGSQDGTIPTNALIRLDQDQNSGKYSLLIDINYDFRVGEQESVILNSDPVKDHLNIISASLPNHEVILRFNQQSGHEEFVVIPRLQNAGANELVIGYLGYGTDGQPIFKQFSDGQSSQFQITSLRVINGNLVIQERLGGREILLWGPSANPTDETPPQPPTETVTVTPEVSRAPIVGEDGLKKFVSEFDLILLTASSKKNIWTLYTSTNVNLGTVKINNENTVDLIFFNQDGEEIQVSLSSLQKSEDGNFVIIDNEQTFSKPTGGFWKQGIQQEEQEEDELSNQVELTAFPFLDQGRRGWVSSESDDPATQVASARYVIEYDRSLCNRNEKPSCGVENNPARDNQERSGFEIFADVVNVSLKQLNGKVVPNIFFNAEGEIERTVGRAEFAEPSTRPKAESFDPNAPVRFIIADSTFFKGPIPADGFSRGWGVDPTTKQLIAVYGSDALQDPKWLMSGFYGILFEMHMGRGQRNEDIDHPYFIKLAETMFGGTPFSEIKKMDGSTYHNNLPFRAIIPNNQ